MVRVKQKECMYVYMYMYMYVAVLSYTHAHAHTHTHVHVHVHTHTYTHTNTRTRTHTHTLGKPLCLRDDNSDTEDSPTPSKKRKTLADTPPTGPPRKLPSGGAFLVGIHSNVPEIDVCPLAMRRGTEGPLSDRYADAQPLCTSL